ncbi:MAG: STAS domain-containing protein [Phycisphaerales bacterium]
MQIEESKQGAVTVLRPRGILGAEEAPVLRARALETFHKTLGRFVIDASDIPFVDSTGLETLYDIATQMSNSGLALKLCGETETLREIFDLTDLSSAFEHYEEVGVAVRSFL